MSRAAPFLLLISVLFTSCYRSTEVKNEVVIYCALDSVFSAPVLKRFEEDTGIRVRIKYDAEASKTTGLTQAILAEKDHPRCDVYWNNEIMQTLRLQSAGVLESYDAPSATGIPEFWRDPDRQWTAIAARARVIVFNPDRITMEELPTTVQELIQPEWKNRTVIAKPLFGTTATHFSALYALWGPEAALDWMKQLKENGVMITDGNASVVRLVGTGERDIGLTDTDDVFMALKSGKNIAWALIGQDNKTSGALLIPNTVALIRNSPNPENGRKLIDYLLSKEVENELAQCDSKQIPLHSGSRRPASIPEFSPAEIDFRKAADLMPSVFKDIRRELL